MLSELCLLGLGLVCAGGVVPVLVLTNSLGLLQSLGNQMLFRSCPEPTKKPQKHLQALSWVKSLPVTEYGDKQLQGAELPCLKELQCSYTTWSCFSPFKAI